MTHRLVAPLRSALARTRLAHRLRVAQGGRALRRLPTPPLDASSLAVAAPGLTTLAQGEVSAEEWEAVATRVADLGLAESVQGGVNAGDRRALYHLVRRLGAVDVLEAGTHIGASTVHIALALAANGPSARMTTVDIADVNDPVRQPWKDFGSPLSPRAAVEQLGVGDRVTFACKPVVEFFGELGDETYDLIFLDGDHKAPAVYQEVPLALSRLRPGGHILLHDFFPGLRPLWPDGAVIPGPWLAIERLRRDGAPLVGLPLGELPWPTKQGTNVTSLALLARTEP